MVTAMRFTLCFLASFVFVVSGDECLKNWPSDLKPLDECCSLPFTRTTLRTEIELKARKSCIGIEPDVSFDKLRTCMELNFILLSGIITADMKMNLTVAKSLFYYSHNLPEWEGLFDEFQEKCKPNFQGTLTDDLQSFLKCMRENLSKNCLAFNDYKKGCDEVENYYNTHCKSFEPDCNKSLKAYALHDCCMQSPCLVIDDFIRKCIADCHRLEYFEIASKSCFRDCIMSEKKFFKGHQVDLAAVKSWLIASSNNSVEWDKPIDNAIKTCESKAAIDDDGW